MESLTCPKCRGEMRTYERSGVTVDQCGECRGIFLDRGELDRLVDAETSFHAPSAAAAPGAARPPAPAYGYPQARPDHRDREYTDRYRDDDHHRYDRDPYPKKNKRRSFLEELFD